MIPKRGGAVIAIVGCVAFSASASDVAAHDGCHSTRCERRVERKHKKRVVKPHRAWLASVRACEVRGQPRPYRTNTGNSHYGAYQFTLSSWAAVGGRGMPHRASKLDQDYRAVRLLRLQGRGAWPVCG